MHRIDAEFDGGSCAKFSLDQTINYLLHIAWLEFASLYHTFKSYLPLAALIILLSLGVTSDGTLSFSVNPDSNSLLNASLGTLLSKIQSARKYIESLTWSELLVINLFLIIFFAIFAVAAFCLVTCIWGEEAVVRWIHARNARKRALENSEGGPPEQGIVGLVNLGNTCYMNTVLICLSAIPEFSDYFAEGRYRLPPSRGRRRRFVMSDLLRDVFLGIRSDKHRAFAPEAFHFGISTLLPHFAGSDQQDNQEFLLALLSFLHEELGAGGATYPLLMDSPISPAVGGDQSSKAGHSSGRRRRLRLSDQDEVTRLESEDGFEDNDADARKEKRRQRKAKDGMQSGDGVGISKQSGAVADGHTGVVKNHVSETTVPSPHSRQRPQAGEQSDAQDDNSNTTSTIVTSMFQGEQVTQTRCPTCDNVVVCNDTFLSLPLSLPPCTRYYSVQVVSIAAQVPIDGKDIIRAANSVLLRNYEKLYRQSMLQNAPPPKKTTLFPVPKYAPIIEQLVAQLPLLSFHSVSVSHPSSMFTFKDILARTILQYCARRLRDTLHDLQSSTHKYSNTPTSKSADLPSSMPSPTTGPVPFVDVIRNAMEVEHAGKRRGSPRDVIGDVLASLENLETTLAELSGSIAQQLPFDMVIGSVKNGILQNRYSVADSTSALPSNLVAYCVPHIPPRILNWQALLVVQRVREWRINQDQVPYDETLGILPVDAQVGDDAKEAVEMEEDGNTTDEYTPDTLMTPILGSRNTVQHVDIRDNTREFSPSSSPSLFVKKQEYPDTQGLLLKKDPSPKEPEAPACTCSAYCTVPEMVGASHRMDTSSKRCMLTPMVLNGNANPPVTNRRSLYCICRDDEFADLRMQYCTSIKGTFLEAALEKNPKRQNRKETNTSTQRRSTRDRTSARTTSSPPSFPDISVETALEVLEEQDRREATLEKADYFPCLYIHPQSLPLLLYVLEGYNATDVMEAVQRWTEAIQTAHTTHLESQDIDDPGPPLTVASLPLNQSPQRSNTAAATTSTSNESPSSSTPSHTRHRRDIWKHATPRHSLLHSDFIECYLCQGAGLGGNDTEHRIGSYNGGNSDGMVDLCTGCDADLWLEMEENRTRIALRHRNLQSGGTGTSSSTSGGGNAARDGTSKVDEEIEELLPLSMSRLPSVITIDWWTPSNLPSPQTLQIIQTLSQVLTSTLLPMPPSDLLQSTIATATTQPNLSTHPSTALPYLPNTNTAASSLACPYEGTLWWHLTRLDLCARYRSSPDPTTCLCGVCDMRIESPTPDTSPNAIDIAIESAETMNDGTRQSAATTKLSLKRKEKGLSGTHATKQRSEGTSTARQKNHHQKDTAKSSRSARRRRNGHIAPVSTSYASISTGGDQLSTGQSSAETEPSPALHTSSQVMRPASQSTSSSSVSVPGAKAVNSSIPGKECTCPTTHACMTTVFATLTRILLRPLLRYRTDEVTVTTPMVLETLNTVPFPVLYILFAHEFEDLCKAYYTPGGDVPPGTASSTPAAGVQTPKEVPVDTHVSMPPIVFAPLVYFARLVGVEFVTYWLLQSMKQQGCLPLLNFFLQAYNDWVTAIAYPVSSQLPNDPSTLSTYISSCSSTPVSTEAGDKQSSYEFWMTKAPPTESNGTIPTHRVTQIPQYLAQCSLSTVPLLDTTKDHIGVGSNWLAFELLSFLRKATLSTIGTTCTRALEKTSPASVHPSSRSLSRSFLSSVRRGDPSESEPEATTESRTGATHPSPPLRLFSIHPLCSPAPSSTAHTTGNNALTSSLLLPESDSHGLFRLPIHIPNPYSCLNFTLTSPFPYPLYPAAPPPPVSPENILRQFQFNQVPLQTYTTADKTEKMGSKVSLTECLDLYVAPSELSVDNVWKCSYCNDKVQALRQTLLSSAPRILCIALKRIIPLSDYGDMDKTDVTVEFPLQSLDLSPWMEGKGEGKRYVNEVDENGKDGTMVGTNGNNTETGAAGTSRVRCSPPVYDLFAVCDHIGSLQTGHYTSVIRGKSGTWYFINDQLVEPVLSEDALEDIRDKIAAEEEKEMLAPEEDKPASTRSAWETSGDQGSADHAAKDIQDLADGNVETKGKNLENTPRSSARSSTKYREEMMKALGRKIVNPATCALFYIRRDPNNGANSNLEVRQDNAMSE